MRKRKNDGGVCVCGTGSSWSRRPGKRLLRPVLQHSSSAGHTSRFLPYTGSNNMTIHYRGDSLVCPTSSTGPSSLCVNPAFVAFWRRKNETSPYLAWNIADTHNEMLWSYRRQAMWRLSAHPTPAACQPWRQRLFESTAGGAATRERLHRLINRTWHVLSLHPLVDIPSLFSMSNQRTIERTNERSLRRLALAGINRPQSEGTRGDVLTAAVGALHSVVPAQSTALTGIYATLTSFCLTERELPACLGSCVTSLSGCWSWGLHWRDAGVDGVDMMAERLEVLVGMVGGRTGRWV